MSASKPRGHARRQLFTVLLVGEGHAEETLLRHLRSLYIARGSGVTATIRNARGKGAAHVVDYAMGQTRNAAYDRMLVLLDTDTDWTDAVRKKAAQACIDVIACEPCLEALLLRAHGAALRDGCTSRQLKQQFAAQFGCAADEPRVYETHFGRERLEQARRLLPELDRLLHALLP